MSIIIFVLIYFKQEWVKDIDINDVKNRYLLTKSENQKKIKTESGADITTRGRYYPDSSLATDKDPPLYLHLSAKTEEMIKLAIVEIKNLLEQADAPVHTPPPVERPQQLQQLQQPQELVSIY